MRALLVIAVAAYGGCASHDACSTTAMRFQPASNCLEPIEAVPLCVSGRETKGIKTVCAFAPDGSVYAVDIGTEETARAAGWRFHDANVTGSTASDGSQLSEAEMDECAAIYGAPGACSVDGG